MAKLKRAVLWVLEFESRSFEFPWMMKFPSKLCLCSSSIGIFLVNRSYEMVISLLFRFFLPLFHLNKPLDLFKITFHLYEIMYTSVDEFSYYHRTKTTTTTGRRQKRIIKDYQNSFSVASTSFLFTHRQFFLSIKRSRFSISTNDFNLHLIDEFHQMFAQLTLFFRSYL